MRLRRVGAGGRASSLLREGDALSPIGAEGLTTSSITVAAQKGAEVKGMLLLVARFTPCGSEGGHGSVSKGVEVVLEAGADSLCAAELLVSAVDVDLRNADLVKVMRVQKAGKGVRVRGLG